MMMAWKMMRESRLVKLLFFEVIHSSMQTPSNETRPNVRAIEKIPDLQTLEK